MAQSINSIFFFLLTSVFAFGQNQERIKRIENTILPPIIIKGTDYEKTTIKEMMKQEKVPGLSIVFVDNGKIAWTKCYGFADTEKKIPVTPNTLFAAASISKPLTALAVLKLVQKGSLDLDKDVNTYLTSWKIPDNDFTKTEKVTLRRLLGHTAGIESRVFKYYAPTDKLPTTTQLLRGGAPSKDTVVQLDNIPGAKANYSNAGYVIIQQILEDVLKKPFDEIIDELVIQPAKMTKSTIKQPLSKSFQDKVATGYFADGKKVTDLVMPFMSAAALYTTPSELGLLMIELQNEYAGLSSNILSKDMAHKLFEKDNNSLGFFKAVNNKDILFYHKGHNDGFGSEFNGLLLKKQGVIVMTNGDLGHHIVEKIVRAVANEYQWDYLTTKEYTLLKINAEEINNVCGKYEMPQDKMTISQKEGKVYFHSEYGGNELQEIFPIAKNQFINPKIPITITFQEDANKVISGLNIEAFGQVYMAVKKQSYPEKAPNKILFEDKEITEKWLAERHIPALGIGVIKDGKMSQISVFGNLEKGKPAPKNTIWNVASLTKPITANVTLRLVSEGKWDLDEPLFHYWIDPDIANDPRHKLLTTRHVLSHQTGFPNWRWNNKSKKLAFDFDPGKKYQYSGEGMEYLRKALEKKFNKTLDVLANELIFKPLNMLDTKFFWDKTVDTTRFAKWHNPKGELYETYKNTKANGADDVLTTLEDYGHFLISIMNSEGLSKPVFEDMVKHQVKTKNGKYFGLGFEIYDLDNGDYALSHGGSDKGVQTIVFIFPKTKQGLLIFTNVDDGHKVYETLLKQYLGENGKRIFEIETK